MKNVVGILALQGAFIEHVRLLKSAVTQISLEDVQWDVLEVRTSDELARCQALIIPGGESTSVALVAARSGLLEPLRQFVQATSRGFLLWTNLLRIRQGHPTWGTCAGLILLAADANCSKQGGQELIGGLDVRVNRNYFGRQTESFQTLLHLPFLDPPSAPFPGIFIRAPVVEAILHDESRVIPRPSVEVLATLPGPGAALNAQLANLGLDDEAGDIVAVRQGHVFGTSFHPELTADARIHAWWLRSIAKACAELRPA